MWISTADGQWYLHHIHGVVFVTWVQRSAIAQALKFSELPLSLLETVKQLAGRDDLVVVRASDMEQ